MADLGSLPVVADRAVPGWLEHFRARLAAIWPKLPVPAGEARAIRGRPRAPRNTVARERRDVLAKVPAVDIEVATVTTRVKSGECVAPALVNGSGVAPSPTPVHAVRQGRFAAHALRAQRAVAHRVALVAPLSYAPMALLPGAPARARRLVRTESANGYEYPGDGRAAPGGDVVRSGAGL